MTHRGIPHVLTAGLIAAALAVAGCTSSSEGGKAATALDTAAPAPPTGSATVVLAGQNTTLPIQLCVKSGASTVNVTATSTTSPPSTLTVNLGDPPATSTFVYTIRKSDGGYTNYALAGANATPINGVQKGNRITVAGKATMQAYDAKGGKVGSASQQAVSADVSCRVIEPMQPPPVFASTTHAKKPSTSPTATASKSKKKKKSSSASTSPSSTG